MRCSLRTSATVTAIAAMTIAPSAGQSSTIRMSESSIRRLATETPRPEYPEASLAAKRDGVAVAAIASELDGRISSVTILEAPDEAIGSAVSAALRQWVVDAVTVAGRSERFGVRGKVTFYFRVVDGRGRVFHPEEMPGGPKPEPAGGPPASPPGVRRGGVPTPPPGPPPVASGHAPEPDLEIGEPAFRQLLAAERPTVLDIRERDAFRREHRDGAVNIPRDELAIRSWIEIDRHRPVVIDCTFAETSECHSAARLLRRFAKVLVLLP